jgi:hypothetical protein
MPSLVEVLDSVKPHWIAVNVLPNMSNEEDKIISALLLGSDLLRAFRLPIE